MQPLAIDTLPLNDGFIIDTIIEFDPVTFEEKVQVVRTRIESDHAGGIIEKILESAEKFDTVIVFDSETLKSDTVIVRHKPDPKK